MRQYVTHTKSTDSLSIWIISLGPKFLSGPYLVLLKCSFSGSSIVQLTFSALCLSHRQPMIAVMGLDVMKPFYAQPRMKFILLINVEMPIIGILTCISRINKTTESF